MFYNKMFWCNFCMSFLLDYVLISKHHVKLCKPNNYASIELCPIC